MDWIYVLGGSLVRIWLRLVKHLRSEYPGLIMEICTIFIGALLALQLTQKMNAENDKQNYLSMLNSCQNMNEHYLQNVKSIIDTIHSDSINYSDLNRSIKNIDQPFLFVEILKNSNLYKNSSRDFRNWLPEVISFLEEANWTITEKNINKYNYNYRYLLHIKNLLINEEKYINDDLSDDQIKSLNDNSRISHQITSREFSNDDFRAKRSYETIVDSNNAIKLINK